MTKKRLTYICIYIYICLYITMHMLMYCKYIYVCNTITAYKMFHAEYTKRSHRTTGQRIYSMYSIKKLVDECTLGSKSFKLTCLPAQLLHELYAYICMYICIVVEKYMLVSENSTAWMNFSVRLLQNPYNITTSQGVQATTYHCHCHSPMQLKF